MTQQSKLEWTEYKSRFRAVTAYGTYWVDRAACSAGYKLICGTNPCCVVFSSPQEAKDYAQIIHDRPSSRDDWFNLSDVEQAPYHTPVDLSDLLRTYETLLAGDNLPERIAVQTVDLKALLNAAKLDDVAAVLEQCAKVAEDFRDKNWIAHDIKTGIFPNRSEAGIAIADAIRALSPAEPAHTPDFAKSIAYVIKEESLGGATCGWKSCSGCLETSEGQLYGDYPYSDLFKAHVGFGCSDCGGLGVVWEYYSKSCLDEMHRELKTAEPAQAGHWQEISSFGERELGRLIVVGAFDGKGRLCATVRRLQQPIGCHSNFPASLKKAMRLKWEPTHFMELTAPRSTNPSASLTNNDQSSPCCTHCRDTKEVKLPDSDFILPCPECFPTTEAGK